MELREWFFSPRAGWLFRMNAKLEALLHGGGGGGGGGSRRRQEEGKRGEEEGLIGCVRSFVFFVVCAPQTHRVQLLFTLSFIHKKLKNDAAPPLTQ